MDKVLALETKANAPGPQPSTALPRLTDAVLSQCSKTTWYSESDLVELKAAPKDAAKKNLATLKTNLTQWAQAGQVPITFGLLLSGTHSDYLQSAMQLTKEVAGEQI